RRIGKGAPALALATVSATSGDILVGDLDLARGEVTGPLRLEGNLGAMIAAPTACDPGPSAYRLLADVIADVHFDPSSPDRDIPYASATALVSVGGGRACLEGLEVRLPEGNRHLAF